MTAINTTTALNAVFATVQDEDKRNKIADVIKKLFGERIVSIDTTTSTDATKPVNVTVRLNATYTKPLQLYVDEPTTLNVPLEVHFSLYTDGHLRFNEPGYAPYETKTDTLLLSWYTWFDVVVKGENFDLTCPESFYWFGNTPTNRTVPATTLLTELA